jgi:hypothetical protein
LTLKDHEFFVSKLWLNTEQSIAISRASTAGARRVFADLAQAGFPFDGPRKAYVGRQAPPYVVFT